MFLILYSLREKNAIQEDIRRRQVKEIKILNNGIKKRANGHVRCEGSILKKFTR
jgi:hypothetical protein